ncbi:hypothetical protein DFP72DRAFT_863036 [Ephemerocybe angulata]|uniref:Uncharacterized protein n=1 Tax=Ephemerocybe angulata TaxID=980116 RepID=A0A8H6LSK1_9AGAR|nr:hypothetical protein DFP72DRAFT_863036 [Tulosesus angulatus]
MENVTPQTNVLWGEEKKKGSILIIVPHYLDATVPVQHNYVKLLQATTKGLIKAGDSFKIFPATLIKAKTKHTTPLPFILYGEEADKLNILGTQPMWITPTVSFSAILATATPSLFICTLEGYYELDPTEANEKSVGDTVGRELATNAEIIKWAQYEPERYNALPAATPLHKVTEEIAKLITVRHLKVVERQQEIIVWRLYLTKHFTSRPEYFKQFVEKVCAITFQRLEGAGKAKKTNYECACCHGRDHPTGLCPYKQVPGFFDRDPNSYRQAMEAKQDAASTSIQSAGPSGVSIPANNNSSRGHFVSIVGTEAGDRKAFKGKRGTKRRRT